MNVDQLTLNRLATFTEQVRCMTYSVETLRAEGRFQELTGLLGATRDECLVVADLLRQLGADEPAGLPPRTEMPLQLLDTLANRELLAALDRATYWAREVDRERGLPFDGGPADMVDMLREQVHGEIHGAAGSGRE